MEADYSEEELLKTSFTVKQQRFIAEFCVDGNCTQAAKRAGYSADTAYAAGSRLLKNVEIKAAIDARVSEMALGAGQVTKLVSEIAQSRINDFLRIETKQRIPKIQQPLEEAIAELDEEIAFEQAYLLRSVHMLQLHGDELSKYQAERNVVITGLRLKQLRYVLRLEQDPSATREIDGEPIEYEAVKVDMVALAKAQEGGRIKALSFGEFGPKVELYAADAALDKLARMHGLYEKDNRQLGGIDVEIIIGDSPE